MQFASDSRKLAATILVVGLLAAALVVACPDGIHLPAAPSMGAACIAMAHSTALGPAIVSGSGQVLVSQLLAAVALVAGIVFVRSPARRLSAIALQSPPADPLNGRLRI